MKTNDDRLFHNNKPVRCSKCNEWVTIGNICSNCLFICGDCCDCGD